MMTPPEKAFAEWSLCLYEGNIVCSECTKHPKNFRDSDDGCDMSAGRENRQRAFEAGYNVGKIPTNWK